MDTPDQSFTADVAIVGVGRVGLPLALSFAQRGLRVVGIDNDHNMLEKARSGIMPFREKGAQELLDEVHPTGRLTFSDRVTDAAWAEHIILTLGTPAMAHIEIDISAIRSVLDDLMPALRPGHSIILRSTVAPGTTEYVAGYLERQRSFEIGRDIFVSHVPERIAENKALEEIVSLPTIIGSVDEASGEKAASLFEVFGTRIQHTSPAQAELAKIWTNIYRYTMFALPNLLMMDCERYGASVYEVIELINRDYPRGGIATPGFTAGTCLRKDFAFSEERSNAPGMLLAVSRVNETVPLFLVEGAKRRMTTLRGKKVAVLGLSFKRDSDDERDSLSHKLIRLLERELAEVAVHDPHVESPTQSLEDAVRGADAVMVATNHSEFDPAAIDVIGQEAAETCLVADPWNCFGANEVFVPLAALTAVRARQTSA